MNNGIILSLITVFLWALYDVFVRFVGVNWHVQPLVFISFTNLVAALTLLTVAGRGRLGLDTIRQPHTWGFSFVSVFMDIVFVFVLLYISTTEANLLIRFSIFISALMCWGLLGRKINPMQYIGYLAIIGGTAAVAAQLDPEVRGMSLFLIGIMIICQAVRTLIAETHPSSNKAEKWHDNFRVTGYVLLMTSFAFLGFGFFAALMKASLAPEQLAVLPIMGSLPTLADFTHPATLLAASVLGLTNVSISNYLYFQSTKKVGSETFLMVAAALPIFTYAMEWGAAQYDLLSITSISHSDLMAGLVITAGALWGVAIKALGMERKLTQREKSRMAQAKERAHGALVHFKNDDKRAAEALNVPYSTFVNVLAGEKLYSFNTYRKIKAGFDSNVISKDPLTGLQNRLSFLTQLNTYIAKGAPVTVFMIDLNKFKPVNDTYGHAAGDAVLKEIGHRLDKAYGKRAEATRLGGDEYCLMFHKSLLEPHTVLLEMQDLIAQSIAVEGVSELLQVTASVGYATYPQDAQTPDQLLEIADERMYEGKR